MSFAAELRRHRARAFTRRLHRENPPLIANWFDSLVKLGSKTLVAAFLSGVVLVFAAPALAEHGAKSETPAPRSATVSVQGVVQSLNGSAVVVRQLDGSTVTVGINRSTRITIDGRSGKITDVKPGFVLVTTFKAGQPASTIRLLRPS